MSNQKKLETQDTKDEEKQNKNTTHVGHHYMQTNTDNANKTWAVPETTGSKDEPNGHHNTELRNQVWQYQIDKH